MKNNIFFKFLAIVLCALCLFGSVAATVGMFLFAEGNLYNKTVDQMLADRFHNDGIVYADYLARQYASEHLGGMPSVLVDQQFGYGNQFFLTYDQEHYGYSVLDAEGNEVYGYNVDLKNAPSLMYRESFPVVGSYIHLVSLEAQKDVQTALRNERESLYTEEPTLTLYDNLIPAQGTVVNYVAFTDHTGELALDAYNDGNSAIVTIYSGGGEQTFIYHDTQVGLLLFDQTRHLVFHSFFQVAEYFPDKEIKEVSFLSEDGTNLRLSNDAGNIGMLYCTDGNIRFLSSEAAVSAIPEETIPETTEVTVPETTEATVPETTEPTIPEETWTEETWIDNQNEEENWEEENSSASALPGGEWEEAVPPTIIASETTATTLPSEATAAAETIPAEPELYNGKPLTEYQLNFATFRDSSTGEIMDATFIYLPMPEMTVELYLENDALRFAPIYDVLRFIRPYRNYLLPAAICFILLFVLFGVYLVAAAGRKPRQETIRVGGLNRLPLDLYLLLGGALICGLVAVPVVMANLLLKTDFYLFCGLTSGAVYLACLIFVGFCFAWAAQWKTGGKFVWKNSLFARILGLLVYAAIGLERFSSARLVPALVRLLKKIGSLLLAISRMLGRWAKSLSGTLFRGIHHFLQLLPLTWQWLLGGLLLIIVAVLGGAAGGIGLLLAIALSLVLVLYGSYSFGILADSTRRMSQGDLETQVDDRNLLGCFKESAADLNALADVAVIAAQKQLKSERMKTELITNVSHDIKTPLTSIINYVDLLQKPHTQLEQEEYLEVLDRQSQRLKKLIDDLMDMSKANTGNMTVEITCLDAVESVNQALGEFADKLDRAHLFPVFRHSVASAPILADGKLVWRVMSNLLGNAVKYAMPGTRLYIDLMDLEGKIVISLKNISREELNVGAEELMERFVRGDDSRNTEGSGLGLNIAKSLMELQKGQLQILVDGDLFKVTLTFPGA